VARLPIPPRIAIAAFAAFFIAACGHDSAHPGANAAPDASASANVPAQSPPAPAIAPSDQAPPPSQTGGFDGAAAYDFTAKLVSFGPHPPDTDAIRRVQAYLVSQLKSFGCAVDTDDFHASTPIGDLAMENVIAKVPGSGQGIILLLTHYDTLRLDYFVGAVDSGSSSGLMLEMARLFCGQSKKQPNAVWIAFLDGEEAQVVRDGVAQWTATDSVYGSRELAARLAISGDLKRIKAVILADMVGPKNLKIRKERDSTPWLTDLIWKTASRLGYQNYFVDQTEEVDDDHMPFIRRQVPAADIIDLDEFPYWHTTQDTLDKVSPRSLAIVGHVILEVIVQLQAGKGSSPSAP
jgi:glutaminyl-peptide cyclotransferase